MSLKYKSINTICKKRFAVTRLLMTQIKHSSQKEFKININTAPFAVHQSMDS